MRKDIMISIYCLTYNHKDYIRDTLDGILMQKTSYRYNVMVIDDASTDGTSEILREYERKYPEIFNMCILPENTYRTPKRKMIFDELFKKYLVGKYVAICEGDDYWTDENKLQTQVEFMETHPECSMTAHETGWLDCRTNEMIEHCRYNENRYVTAEDIICRSGLIHTSSLLIKKEVMFKSKDFPKCDVGDYPIKMYALTKGKVYYFSKEMSVYRYMHDGSWSNEMLSDGRRELIHIKNVIRFISQYDIYTKGIYNRCIKKYIIMLLFEAAEITLEYECSESIVRDISDCAVMNSGEFDEICRWFFSLQVMSTAEKGYIQRFKHIVIMGKGKYSHFVERYLELNNIVYDGYVISRGEVKEPNVWTLETYPYDRDETLVIVGINQGLEDEIRTALLLNDYKNVLYPLWIEGKL